MGKSPSIPMIYCTDISLDKELHPNLKYNPKYIYDLTLTLILNIYDLSTDVTERILPFSSDK